MKESPWFGPEDKPARKGIYKVYYPSLSFYNYWAFFDGKDWGWASIFYEDVQRRGIRNFNRPRYWKGIVK